jgi:tRNA-splicing endonuclease subunit Sen34
VAQRTAARVGRNRVLAEAAWADEDRRAAASAAKSAKAGAAGAEKRAARAKKRAEAAKAKALAEGEDEKTVEERYAAAVAAIEAAPPPPTLAVKERGVPSAENTNLFTVVPALPVVALGEGEEAGSGMGQRAGAGDAASASSSVQYFPRSVRDRALAGTFAALNARGLRMGLGPRFGGEWLVYPGDYLRYHAHFTSQVIVRDEPIRPAELVAWGRLGTGTKKAGLLCCWDDGVREGTESKEGEGEGEGEVVFYSLEWANFG